MELRSSINILNSLNEYLQNSKYWLMINKRGGYDNKNNVCKNIINNKYISNLINNVLYPKC